jgi:hypothetical protein
MPFLEMARCGGANPKTLDMSAFFHSAPFRLMARCAVFLGIIQRLLENDLKAGQQGILLLEQTLRTGP